jgi:hypothetical protein
VVLRDLLPGLKSRPNEYITYIHDSRIRAYSILCHLVSLTDRLTEGGGRSEHLTRGQVVAARPYEGYRDGMRTRSTMLVRDMYQKVSEMT